MKVPQTRYYVVLAMPKDATSKLPILGYVENSFSMGWSATNVHLWQPSLTKVERMNDVRMFNENPKIRENMSDWEGQTAEEYYGDRLNVYQYEWNLAKKHPEYVPEGYEVKIFRALTKNCPIQIDLRRRLGLSPADKWSWRNAPFMENKYHVKFGGEFDFPENIDEWKQTTISKEVPRVKVEGKQYTPKERADQYIDKTEYKVYDYWDDYKVRKKKLYEFEKSFNSKKIFRREKKMKMRGKRMGS